MKKAFWLLSVILSASLVSKANDSTFTIKGKFDNVKTGKVYLSVYFTGKSTRDSATIKDGKFKFTGSVKESATAVLTMEGKRNDYFTFYVEPTNLSIEGKG